MFRIWRALAFLWASFYFPSGVFEWYCFSRTALRQLVHSAASVPQLTRSISVPSKVFSSWSDNVFFFYVVNTNKLCGTSEILKRSAPREFLFKCRGVLSGFYGRSIVTHIARLSTLSMLSKLKPGVPVVSQALPDEGWMPFELWVHILSSGFYFWNRSCDSLWLHVLKSVFVWTTFPGWRISSSWADFA